MNKLSIILFAALAACAQQAIAVQEESPQILSPKAKYASQGRKKNPAISTTPASPKFVTIRPHSPENQFLFATNTPSPWTPRNTPRTASSPEISTATPSPRQTPIQRRLFSIPATGKNRLTPETRIQSPSSVRTPRRTHSPNIKMQRHQSTPTMMTNSIPMYPTSRKEKDACLARLKKSEQNLWRTFGNCLHMNENHVRSLQLNGDMRRRNQGVSEDHLRTRQLNEVMRRRSQRNRNV
ncbi:hypothetical protein HOD08_03195 [bacterium]|nr:hypothetical protein [bacterium]